jgi:hypothetical protein
MPKIHSLVRTKMLLLCCVVFICALLHEVAHDLFDNHQVQNFFEDRGVWLAQTHTTCTITSIAYTTATKVQLELARDDPEVATPQVPTLSAVLQPVVAHWQKLVTPAGGDRAYTSAVDCDIDVNVVIFAALLIIDGVQ